jgi:hypothetical protein
MAVPSRSASMWNTHWTERESQRRFWRGKKNPNRKTKIKMGTTG